jgi:hypothetical protein
MNALLERTIERMLQEECSEEEINRVIAEYINDAS